MPSLKRLPLIRRPSPTHNCANMKILWRIYFDIHPTFSNINGDWEAAPKHGIVVINVQRADPHWGRVVLSGYTPINREFSLPYKLPAEIFIKNPGSDEPYVTNSPIPFLDKFPGREDCIKYGRQVDQLEWQRIQTLAGRDSDFKSKNNFKRRASDWDNE